MRSGIVSCIKLGAGDREPLYFILEEGDGRIAFGTAAGGLRAECGEAVECDSEGRITSVADGGGGLDRIDAAASGLCRSLASNPVYATGNGVVDETTSRMWGAMASAARLLVRKLLYSAPVIVRFHNDADGSGGAMSLNAALRDVGARSGGANANVVWMMHRGVVYGVQDAAADAAAAGGYCSVEKPLLVLVDFGTTAESNRGIEALRGGFDIVWLDHHPLAEGFEGVKLTHYINPWSYGGDSNYTAGLLASAFSKTFSVVDTHVYEQASLIGDYSSHADLDDPEARETSMLLDFITSDLEAVYGPSKSNVTPQEIEAVLSNPPRRKELLDYANIRLEEAIERGMASARLHETPGAFVYVLDFEDVRDDGSKYPLPGRFSSKLLARLNGIGMRRVVIVVYVGAYVLLRADKELCGEISMLDVIAEIKGMHGDMVENGGGHRCAGAVKLREKGYGRDVAASAVRAIRNRVAGIA